MVFFCQRDSYATNYHTTVVSCTKAKLQLVAEGVTQDEHLHKNAAKKKKPQEISCYEIVFEDTVLFPEGGGQPDDHGTIVSSSCASCCGSTVSHNNADSTVSPNNADSTVSQNNTDKELPRDVNSLTLHDASSSHVNNSNNPSPSMSLQSPDGVGVCTDTINGPTSATSTTTIKGSCSCHGHVLRVLRRGGDAVHYVDRSYQIGERVEQHVDWPRRKEHMQQHSAQHLITAIADSEYGFATTSWSLGGVTSSIELHTCVVTAAQLQDIEQRANRVIASAVPVTVREYEPQDPELDARIRSRGLPADATGPVRVVTIAGVDANMCCGTHVTNTAQLQAVKLLHVEHGKQGKTLLTFVAGDRLVRFLHDYHTKIRSLQTVLNTNSDSFIGNIQKNQNSLKLADKTSKEALKDLAACEARLFKAEQRSERLWCHHRRLADMDYLNALVNGCDDQDILKIFTAGEEKGPGLLVIHGPPELVAAIAPQVCSVLEGKGGGKTRYTAKVSALHKRDQAYKLVEQYLATKLTK